MVARRFLALVGYFSSPSFSSSFVTLLWSNFLKNKNLIKRILTAKSIINLFFLGICLRRCIKFPQVFLKKLRNLDDSYSWHGSEYHKSIFSFVIPHFDLYKYAYFIL